MQYTLPTYTTCGLERSILMLSAQDANKIIAFLAAAYSCTNSKDAKEEFHRLANELRKASGQPEE